MSNVAKHPWIIFGGSDGKCDKLLMAGWNEVFKHWTCSIYQLKEPIDRDSEATRDDIQNHITSLAFTNPESLDSFMDVLDKLRDKWQEADMAMAMEEGKA